MLNVISLDTSVAGATDLQFIELGLTLEASCNHTAPPLTATSKLAAMATIQ